MMNEQYTDPRSPEALIYERDETGELSRLIREHGIRGAVELRCACGCGFPLQLFKINDQYAVGRVGCPSSNITWGCADAVLEALLAEGFGT